MPIRLGSFILAAHVRDAERLYGSTARPQRPTTSPLTAHRPIGLNRRQQWNSGQTTLPSQAIDNQEINYARPTADVVHPGPSKDTQINKSVDSG